MPTLDKPLRQSVTLPTPEPKQIKRIAKASNVSISRVIADLVKTGLAAQEQEKRHFLGLIDKPCIGDRSGGAEANQGRSGSDDIR